MRGVMMLVNDFPPVPAGGAERQAERISEYLATSMPVSVITRSAWGLPKREWRTGYWIERIPQLGIGKLKTVTFMIGSALFLLRRRKEYDILHAHLAFSPALVGAMIARLLGKRLLVVYGTSGLYGDVVVSQQTLRGRLRIELLKRWTDISIVLDEEMERELLDTGYPRQRVLRMDYGIDADSFAGLQREQARKDLGLTDKLVAIFTGRFVAQKTLPNLLHAVARVLVTQPQLHLLLVGKGPEHESLETLANSLGIHDHITFVGNVNDVRPYLAAADLFVLPSMGEGISNSLLEAMASGLPCIATSVGGTPEVLDNGSYGLVIPPFDIDALTEAIACLAQDPVKREQLGIAARQRILTRYSFAVTGELYRSLYARLLDTPLPFTAAVDPGKEAL